MSGGVPPDGGDEKRRDVADQELLAEFRRVALRRGSAIVAACVVAIVAPAIIAARGGESLRGAVLGVCAALLVWSTVAVYTAFHTRSLPKVAGIEIDHLTVWATAVLMHLLGGITWTVAAGSAPASVSLMLAHTAVMVLGWAVLHSRIIELRRTGPDKRTATVVRAEGFQ